MFAREKGLDHYSIKSTEAHVKKGIYHIQNVNNYHKRLKDWLAHFNGVASGIATREVSGDKFKFDDLIKPL